MLERDTMTIMRLHMQDLANFIILEIPGELSQDERIGACAVRLLDKYRTALANVMSELGVPGPGYPMPVANAYEIAAQALGHEGNDGAKEVA